MTGQRRKIAVPTLIFVLFISLSEFPVLTLADNYQISYQLVNHPDGSTHYRLNIVIPQTLWDYYEQRSHSLNSISDFAKFVTPYALEPIAVSLRQIYGDDEDFSNAVLMIVHQIPYQVTLPSKYPIETMVDNTGDCDLFSCIAASIVKAGGLQAVLFYYEGEVEAHMNIGISLPQAPQDARNDVYYVDYGGRRYYVAECTGDNWQTGWRVGEYSEDQHLDSVQVISLEDIDDPHTGQVSASYENLETSTISLAISPTFLIQDGIITLTGDLNPRFENATVTIYSKMNGSPWKVLDTTPTREEGHFSYAFSAENAGICEIRVSWSGDHTFAAADSPVRTVTILSTFFLVLLTMTVVLACLGMAALVMARKRHGLNTLEPQPPQEFT
jgi:hypothetical protein